MPAPDAPASTALAALGAACVAAGETLRLWGVHHIGAISRTRSDRLGPLIDGGPFAHVRNPLYIGNILLWIGFAVAAQLAWMAPWIAALLWLEYHAIVRWEEQLLRERLGDAYREYQARVPRWIPQVRPTSHTTAAAPVAVHGGRPQPDLSWKATLFSERGTLIAIAAGFFLLWLKARF